MRNTIVSTLLFVVLTSIAGSTFAEDLSLDRYYYTPDIQEMQVTLIWDANRGASYKIVLQDQPNGKIFISHQIFLKENKSKYTASFNLKNLDIGRYIISAHLLNSKNQELNSIHRVFFKKKVGSKFSPSAHPKISIRPDGILLLDGKPFCPFFASSTDFDSPLAKNSFNVRYGQQALVSKPLERLRTGLPWITKEDGKAFIDMPEEKELYQRVRDAIITQKSNPMLLCWFLKYEAYIPMYRGKTKPDRVRLDNVAELKKINQFIKSLDPDHPTTIQIDNPFKIEAYKDIADILEISYGGLSSYAKDPIPGLARNVDNLKATLQGKPFFFWIGSSIPEEKYRTAENIRCASYLSLMHGAAGITFHMGHNGIPLASTRHWSVYPGLAAEIEELFPILTTLPQHREHGIRPLNSEIDYCVREYNNRLYLISVNTSDKLVNATMQIEDGSVVPKRVKVLFENRYIELDGNQFTDNFTAYEPHVYEILPPKKN
jgi:hypothetical protein